VALTAFPVATPPPPPTHTVWRVHVLPCRQERKGAVAPEVAAKIEQQKVCMYLCCCGRALLCRTLSL
jgi:hypothetical protein